jgi:hypothetical protein
MTYPTFPSFDPNDFTFESACDAIASAEACVLSASSREVLPGHKYAFTIPETCFVARGSHAVDFIVSCGRPVPECPGLMSLIEDEDFISIATAASDRVWDAMRSSGPVGQAAYCASIGMADSDFTAAMDEWWDANPRRPAPLVDAIGDRILADESWEG